MPNMCYPLPERAGWETAQVDHYVSGDPTVVNNTGQKYDSAGSELEKLATELTGMSVESYWKGDAADAFVALKAKIATGLNRTGAMGTDLGKILQDWHHDLSALQESDKQHIQDGQRAWADYKTAKNAGKDTHGAQQRMNTARQYVADESAASVQKAKSYQGRVAEASANTSVNAPTASSASPTLAFAKEVPPGGAMPPGAAPQPFIGPVIDESKRPMTDPRNGRLVKPAPGSPAVGPPTAWVYVN